MLGQRDVRGAQVVAAEADVGGQQVAGGVVLDLRAVRRDRGDAAVDDRGDAHPALAVDAERVEQLVAGQAVQHVDGSTGVSRSELTGPRDDPLR